MRTIALTAALVAAFFMAACSATVTPKTPRESLAVAEYTYQGVLDEVQTAARLGTLRGDAATTAADRLSDFKVTLDAFRAAILSADPGDDFDAQRATDAALRGLLAYLETTGAIDPLPEEQALPAPEEG